MKVDNLPIDMEIEIKNLLNNKINETICSISNIKGGINSSIYKITTFSGREYIAKKYFSHPGDARERLYTEFNAFSLLWEKGIKNVPEPICLDKFHNIGIYSFIKGKKLKSGEISKEDISLILLFLNKIYNLSKKKEANNQPIASDACFSIEDCISQIERRLNKLEGISLQSELFGELKLYINNNFLPFFYKIKEFVIKEAISRNINITHKICREEMILSPSDFGFHNSIKSIDGSIVFLDFEYYGWDDPAKLVSDFYLHPGIPVPYIFREFFFQEICKFLSKKFIYRLPFYYILLGLNWCLIILNIYIKKSMDETINEQIVRKQLNKSQNKLKEHIYEFESKIFPISLILQK